IAATEPHLDASAFRWARLDPAQQLEAHARLADALDAGHQDGARDRLRHALVEQTRQHAELAIAADARHRLAEQRAANLDDIALARQDRADVIASDIEPRVEETGGDVVEPDPLRTRTEQTRRTIDRFADRPLAGHHAATGGKRDRRCDRDGLERECAP